MSDIPQKAPSHGGAVKNPAMHVPSMADKARLKARSVGAFSGMVWELATRGFKKPLSPADCELLRCATSGDEEGLRASLALGARPGVVSHAGDAPLALAAAAGSLPCVESLLRAGASARKIDAHGRSVLWAVCLFSQPMGIPSRLECAQALLQAGADPLRRDDFGSAPLSRAAVSAESESGLDMRIFDALLAGSSGGRARSRALTHALSAAASQGKLASVKALLALGAIPRLGRRPGTFDALDADPAMAAATGKDKEGGCLRAILQAGGDIETRNQLSHTLLMVVAKERNPAMIDILVSFGAALEDVDAHGSTALCYAAWSGFSDCAAELLRAGANPNHVDASGLTPAHYAAAHAMDPKLVALMLDAGADPELRDSKGRDMLDIAKERNSDERITMLENRAFARALSDEFGAPAVGSSGPSRRPGL